MKLLLRLLAVLALAAPLALRAQTSTSPGTPSKSAGDHAWDNLVSLRKSLSAPPGVPSLAPANAKKSGPVAQLTGAGLAPKSEQRLKAEREVQARNTRRAAQAAKDFYSHYPDHPQAAAAKKIEALDALAGLVDGDAAYEQSALKTAGDYRADKKNSPHDRFEVAHAMERHAVEQKLHGTPWVGHAAEGEMLADRLHAEFGELPEVYGTYLALAEHTNCDNSRIVAAHILQMPAPAAIKAAAQRLRDRGALLRQPLDFPLTTDQGKATTLAKLAGKTTVVVFWDGAHDPGGPPGLADFKKNLRPDTQWIYVSMGAPGALPAGAKPLARPPGTTCVEAQGFKSTLAEKLKLTRVPWVLVLDDKQKLSGFGGPGELSWLLNNLNRPFEP